MKLKTRKRVLTANKDSHKKTYLRILTILLLLLSIYTFYTYYTTNKKIIVDYENWYVVEGDCLWDIADHYTLEDMDKRKVIYEIQKRNGINSYIREGQILEVPIYE